MKILLVSFWFPPTNSIGAVRTGKFAKYMCETGNDIRILAGPTTGKPNLPLEVRPELVFRSESIAAEGQSEFLPWRLFYQLRGRGRSAGQGGGPLSKLEQKMHPLGVAIRSHYYALRYIPDSRLAWGPPALEIGRKLLRTWRPDIIIASAPPYTGLRVARALSRESGIPWIAELRDPWSKNPYNDLPWWRRWVDRQVERATLHDAAALVTVSPIVARDLRKHYHQPIINVFNGYAAEDLPAALPPQPTNKLSIVYTGTIYAGHRDPSPLFAAIAQLGDQRQKVEVWFYGPAEAEVRHVAERFGVQEQVFVGANLSYRDSLAAQASASVLLLLQRNHPTDEGNIPAKFFEYMAARRPILLLGYERGIVAQMIRDRQAGFVSNTPAEIARQLSLWIDQLPYGISPLPREACNGLDRATQFAEYEAFLHTRLDAVQK